MRSTVVSALFALLWLTNVQAQTYNAVNDFSVKSNPNGVWSYWDTGTYVLIPATGFGLTGWVLPIPAWGGNEGIVQNISGATLNWPYGSASEQAIVPVDHLFFSTAINTTFVRFTAPQAGSYAISGDFLGIDTVPVAHTVGVFIDGNGINVSPGNITSFGQSVPFKFVKTLAAGDFVDFANFGLPALGGGLATGLAATITYQGPLSRIGVLPQVAAGGGWDTEIYLTNATSNTASATLSFYDDSGAAASLPLTATQQGNTQNQTTSTLTATIPPNTTLAVDAGAGSPNLVQGWADVQSDGALTGFAVFRYAPQGLTPGPGVSTPWEGTVPLQTQLTASTVVVPFDNTGGFNTGVAVGNLNPSAANLTATFFDDSGNPLGTPQQIALNANGHTSFLIGPTFGFTANFKGLMKVTGSGIMAVGLRASPYGTLTAVPVPLQ